MLFNSIDFAIFLPAVFVLYWFATNHNLRWQNLLIVASSYVFYGWWDWRFLSLVFISSLVDYSVGIALSQTEEKRKRKILLGISIAVNLGMLGFFKYYNFFIENFIAAFSFFGLPIKVGLLNVILPVGISFYSFQTLSYAIDVYRRQLEPTRDFIAFSAFVSFFPQLVAGPIERAGNLLPQFYVRRTFDYAKAADGMRQILWGFFKKIVIADNCGEYANLIFNNSDQYGGSTLVLGALFFTFQIYGDFSGYSDIAIGTARLFGFELMRNFAHPYFSRDVAEFWRRWHISLSTWFRDYLYIPLGGSRGSKGRTVRNVFILFLVSGLWHGANWTFLAWGALNALYFLPLVLRDANRKNLGVVAEGKYLPSLKEAFQMLTTFSLIVLAWIFFRAANIHHAWTYLTEIFSPSLFTVPDFEGRANALLTAWLVAFFIAMEWAGREQQYAIAQWGTIKGRPLRWALYTVMVFFIGMFMHGGGNSFIYFQF